MVNVRSCSRLKNNAGLEYSAVDSFLELLKFSEFTLFERITSLQNPRVKKAVKLFTSRGRRSQGRIIIFGRRELLRATQAGIELDEVFCKESWHEEGQGAGEFVGRLKSDGTFVCVLPDEVFAKVSYGDRDEGIVGIAERPATDLSQIELSPERNSTILVAQAIEKPGNIGAIARTADACGVSAILLSDPLADFFHPNAIRASTGTLFSQQLAVGSSEQIQIWLAENDFSVFPAMVGGATDLFEVCFNGNCAIVVGNEASGLTEKWQRPEFQAVALPMLGTADSLNVSVTASVMLYEAYRQRRTES